MMPETPQQDRHDHDHAMQGHQCVIDLGTVLIEQLEGIGQELQLRGCQLGTEDQGKQAAHGDQHERCNRVLNADHLVIEDTPKYFCQPGSSSWCSGVSIPRAHFIQSLTDANSEHEGHHTDQRSKTQAGSLKKKTPNSIQAHGCADTGDEEPADQGADHLPDQAARDPPIPIQAKEERGYSDQQRKR
jgi:hypothetical protein